VRRFATARSLALAGLVALAPALAWAANADEGRESHGSLVWHAFNLLLILGVIVYFGRAPIRTFLHTRRRQIEEGIESARQELAAAEQRLAECRSRAERLEQELDDIRRVVREQAEAESERLLGDARAAAERIRRDAVAAAEQEVRRARESLRDEAVELAVHVAGELLERNVGDADRTRLLDDFVQRVESDPETKS
jgi:F-type H+-transporting ATPase subunit b